MKTLVLIILLIAGAAVFYFNGGAEKLGWGDPKVLPDTVAPPNATFMGNERPNPYAG